MRKVDTPSRAGRASYRSVWRCLPFKVGCLAAGSVLAGTLLHSTSRAAPPTPQFLITNLTVGEAAEQAGALLRQEVVVRLSPSDPARKIRVTLSMPVGEPGDLLNALASAYGLRWIRGSSGRQVVLVDKGQYQGTSPGLRQALADALPPELRETVTADRTEAGRKVEGLLKVLEERDEQGLEAATAEGPVPLVKLEPVLARTLLHYLNNQSAFELAFACDRAAVDLHQLNRTARFHYGAKPGGARQFYFQVRNNRWISVRPD